MKCTSCGADQKLTGNTYHYVESGLPNVTLHGVDVRKWVAVRRRPEAASTDDHVGTASM